MQIHKSTIPLVTSYEEALALWEKMAKYARSETERPIAGDWRRSKAHYGVHNRGERGIAFRYHETDCVTYYPAGHIVITGYDSVSTNTFVDRLTPNCVTPYFAGNRGELIRLFDRFYLLGAGDWIMVDPAKKLVDHWTPFDDVDLDREKARQALKKWNFDEFKAWTRAYAKMSLDGISSTNPATAHNNGWHLTQLLDRGSWRELVHSNIWWMHQVYSRGGRYVRSVVEFRPQKLFDAVTLAIFEREDVIVTTKRDYLHSLGEWRALRSREIKWKGY